jgi:hypothetical protein
MREEATSARYRQVVKRQPASNAGISRHNHGRLAMMVLVGLSLFAMVIAFPVFLIGALEKGART